MKTIAIASILTLFTTIAWAQDSAKASTQKSSTQVSGSASRMQESSSYKVNRRIRFLGNSEVEEITMDVPPETIRFSLDIMGNIIEGKFVVEIIDPDGNKKGNFSLSTQLTSGANEEVNGHFEKYLNDPQSGTWIIKITPTKANGEIQIRSSFIESH